LSAGSGALPIAAGGTGATTAAAARSNLGAASTSDLTALSAQISAFTASLTNLVSNPQGRLSPTSATPVISSGVTAGPAVYYMPYTGNLCQIYDGTQFNPQIFTELTLTLNSNYVLSSIYDVFIIKDASAGMTVVTGPAWTNITAGSCARGTGAGTTELTRLNGLLVNANAMATARNGSTTYSVAANQGTYVGSIYIDGTAGQITCNTAYGQSRKWAIWNYYNRAPIILKAGDATSSWTYASATVRAANGSSANSLTTFCGIAEEAFDLRSYESGTFSISGTGNFLLATGVGINSTTTITGAKTQQANNPSISINWGGTLSPVGSYVRTPALGIDVITLLEATNTSTITISGGEANNCLTAIWRG
jgi:hypothetical protein